MIIFYKDGKYKVVRVTDKMFVGKNVLYVNIFKKNDKRTIYNVVCLLYTSDRLFVSSVV